MKTLAFYIMVFLPLVGIFFGVYQSYWGADSSPDASFVRHNSNPHYPGVLRFRYAELPDNVLAQSGPLTFEVSELRGVGYESLLVESEEILFVLAYKQFVSTSSEPTVQFGRTAFQRPIAAILNQYGVALNPQVSVEFSGLEDDGAYLVVGDSSYSEDEIKKESLLWHGIQSRLFRLKLRMAEEGLKKKALVAEAQKEKQSIQDYRKEKIFQGQSFSDEDQKQRVNYFLEKYVLQMPIETSLKPPKIKLELKEEWTPSLGNKDSGLTVTVFADFYSAGSQVLLKGLESLSQEFPQVAFNFRPIFPRTDRYQLMVAEMAICLWSQDSESFWPALPGIFKARGDGFEKLLFSAIEEKSQKMPSVKKCYLNRDHKDVVEYHLKTGEFWGVMSLPTALVGGEAFVGPTTVKVLRETIGRHLEVPTAAVWSPSETESPVKEP